MNKLDTFLAHIAENPLNVYCYAREDVERFYTEDRRLNMLYLEFMRSVKIAPGAFYYHNLGITKKVPNKVAVFLWIRNDFYLENYRYDDPDLLEKYKRLFQFLVG